MQLSTGAQTQSAEAAQKDAYRLIVFNQPGTAVLLKTRALGYELPLVNIPKFTRPAQEITAALRDRWHITSVLLFSGAMEPAPDTVYYAALEAQVRTCGLPEGMDWFPAHHAISHLLKDKTHAILESSYLRTTNRMAGDDPEPFSRLGWLSNLQGWVRTVIRPLGMELKDFQQLNGCETFSLIRFDTTKRPVWFKAVGKPSLHEFPITVALAELFPEYVPSLLATQPVCHGADSLLARTFRPGGSIKERSVLLGVLGDSGHAGPQRFQSRQYPPWFRALRLHRLGRSPCQSPFLDF